MAGAANVVPEELVEVAALIKENKLDEALAKWKRVYPVIDLLITTAFIPGVKAGLELQGQPLAPYPADDVARLRDALARLKQG